MKNLLLSAMYSFIWGSVFLLMSHYLDDIIPHFYSTIFAYSFTSVGNFLSQLLIFTGKKTNIAYDMIIKYAILTFLEMATVATVAHYIIINKSSLEKTYEKYIEEFYHEFTKYYTTLSRIIGGMVAFIIVSYPLRKYWVFK